MRKSIGALHPISVTPPSFSAGCLNLAQLAQVWLTSEAEGFPIEAALLSGEETDTTLGWRAASPGLQVIRLIFDSPLTIKRIQLKFNEPECSRTQEFVLRWSSVVGTMHDILRQQYHFSPPGTTVELEQYHVDLQALSMLELSINPDINNNNAFASLQCLKLWPGDI